MELEKHYQQLNRELCLGISPISSKYFASLAEWLVENSRGKKALEVHVLALAIFNNFGVIAFRDFQNREQLYLAACVLIANTLYKNKLEHLIDDMVGSKYRNKVENLAAIITTKLVGKILIPTPLTILDVLVLRPNITPLIRKQARFILKVLCSIKHFYTVDPLHLAEAAISFVSPLPIVDNYEMLLFVKTQLQAIYIGKTFDIYKQKLEKVFENYYNSPFYTQIEDLATRQAQDCKPQNLGTLAQWERRVQDEVKIGQGGFGSVYKVTKDAQNFAIKSQRFRDSLMEVAILRTLKHNHIIKISSFGFTSMNESFIKLTWYETDLAKAIKIHQVLEPNVILKNLLSGLVYLHNNGVIHGDIKPDNILLNNSNDIVIADFGLAIPFVAGAKSRIKRTNAYTFYYRDPRIHQQDYNYSFEADVWALGITLVELYTQRLFSDQQEIQDLFIGDFTGIQGVVKYLMYLFKNIKDESLFADITDDSAKSIIKSMVEWNPDTRITSNQALEQANLLL